MGMKKRLSSSSTPSLPGEPSASSSAQRSPTNIDTLNSTPREEDDSSKRQPSSASTSRHSFLSRLSLPLPLRNRHSNVADFHIRPHEPHKKYSAGEHVRGSVILVVVKPIRITHLTVCLNGYVRVLKDPTVAAKSQALQSGGSERPQYHGNGFASLFRDEQVLSGDGRLDAGKYEFGFDLLFPSKGLPSSIDFERGMISYKITATLTRPTSIAPTKFCETKVMLVEKVDIGLLAPPRPRTIFLEPVSKRKRRKKSVALDKASATSATQEVSDLASDAGSAAPSVITEEPRAIDQQSDIHSEISGGSGRSISTGGYSRTELAQVASTRQQAVDDKTITATVELLRGGCLPGDTVSVRVTVQHIKRIKSMAGVIVTLFRQGKIDSSPPPSLFTDMMTKEDQRRSKKEEAYPRSRIALGGLSLSSSSSTSVFRKDLDQNTAPLIVNPATLQTSVTVSVKLPDDSFPTIRGVPGDMVAFRYQVEVIVDLGERLSNQFQGSQSSRFGQIGTSNYDGKSNSYSPRRGSNIANTTPLRREKGVISVTMETVVGTVDSSQGRAGKRVSPPSRTFSVGLSDDDDAYHTEYSQYEDSHWGTPFVNGQSSSSYFVPQHNSHRNYGGPPPPRSQPPTPAGPSQPYPYQENGHLDEATPAYIPPPQLPDQQNMSDKERIRQAETRLLPSEPSAAEPSSAADSASAPDIYDAEDTPRLCHARPNVPRNNSGEGPSAPTEEDTSTASNVQPVEDKQELQRQFLLAEASAPPDVPDGSGVSALDMAPDAQPSAPVLGHEDEYQGYGVGVGTSNPRDRQHNEQLPAYER